MKKIYVIAACASLLLCTSCGGSSSKPESNASNNGEISSELLDELEAYEADDEEAYYEEAPKLPEGTVDGLFSVSPTRQVRFASGNLQYQPSTKTWRFAPNQYDIMGKNNNDIAEDYEGFIDLFGWATSGYDNDAAYYKPTDFSNAMNSNRAYYGIGEGDLVGDRSRFDWGVNNAIVDGGNKTGLWRTLTQKEWEYLLVKRPMAMQHLALGSVAGVKGLFIMPDDYEDEDIRSLAECDYDTHEYGYYSKYRSYSIYNDFKKSDWSHLENKGVVFLPAGGYRWIKKTEEDNNGGWYWTASESYDYDYSNHNASFIYFDGEGVRRLPQKDRATGLAVRLVQDLDAKPIEFNDVKPAEASSQPAETATTSAAAASTTVQSNSGNTSFANFDHDAFYAKAKTEVMLSDDYFKGLTKSELRILRNEIYARHGYIFKSADLTEFFSQFSWYKPTSKNVNSELNEYETANVTFIQSFEQARDH